MITYFINIVSGSAFVKEREFLRNNGEIDIKDFNVFHFFAHNDKIWLTLELRESAKLKKFFRDGLDSKSSGAAASPS